MNIRYDDETVEATPRWIEALLELMRAECEMMSAHGGDPECWTWGRCIVTNLCSSAGTRFRYGGDEDLPADGLGAFAVVAAEES